MSDCTSAAARPDETLQHLNWLCGGTPSTREIRVLQRAGGPARSAHFDDMAQATTFSQVVSGLHVNVYATLNATGKPPGPGRATVDADVERITNFLIDVDPERPAKTNATDAEKAAALEVAAAVQASLAERGFAPPLTLDSGNGWHLVYAVDLPAADSALIHQLLKALNAKFGTAAAKVDTSVANPSRIAKVAGVPAGKANSAPDRPDRVSRLLQCPPREVTPRETIAAAVAELTSPQPCGAGTTSTAGSNATVKSTAAPNATAAPPLSATVTAADVDALRAAVMRPEHDSRARIDALLSGDPERYVPIIRGKRDDGTEKDTSPSGALLGLASTLMWDAKHVAGLTPSVELLLAFLATTPWHDYKAGRLKWWQDTAAKAIAHAENWTPPAPPREQFPVGLLPPPARALVTEAAAATGCPPELSALPALAVMAGAVGAKYVAEPKANWRESCVIWTMVVADSGAKKSPNHNYAVAPMKKIAAERAAEYRQALKAHQVAMAEHRKLKPKDRGPAPEPPKLAKPLVSDATVEAIADRLEAHPAGLLLERDELDAWVKGMNQYKGGGGSDRAAFLEMHGGGTINVDRKNAERPAIFVLRACVSICGGIQPGIFNSAFGADDFASGQIPRFFVARPPTQPSGWTDATVSDAAVEGWEQLVRRLYALKPCFEVGTDGAPLMKPHVVKLEPDAVAVFAAHVDDTARRMAGASPEMRAALSKLEGGAVRLALVLHLATVEAALDGTVPPITADAMRAGVELANWFAAEAEALYRTRANAAATGDALAARLLAGKGALTARDLQRANCRRFPTQATALEEMKALVAARRAAWANDKRTKIVATESTSDPTCGDSTD